MHTASVAGRGYTNATAALVQQSFSSQTSRTLHHCPYYPDPRDRAACTRFRLRRKAAKQRRRPSRSSSCHGLHSREDYNDFYCHLWDLWSAFAGLQKVVFEQANMLTKVLQTSSKTSDQLLNAMTMVVRNSASVPHPVPPPSFFADTTTRSADNHAPPSSSQPRPSCPMSQSMSQSFPHASEVTSPVASSAVPFGKGVASGSPTKDSKSGISSTLPGLKGMFSKKLPSSPDLEVHSKRSRTSDD
ncbi:hypothetical protein D9758_006379 [Tetrapyrgos nigripes]|uniref:Uncharacterized protein n=1 Tax=Tetrapyrgos nigripes TaxID=182062 RepID=A0A8H5FZJ9_9AGAR|nr:hypothetical protein D9758_006379 [Tetrapyrgos nigripes]